MGGSSGKEDNGFSGKKPRGKAKANCPSFPVRYATENCHFLPVCYVFLLEAGDRGQKTEDRRQRTEDRGQRTEDRGQKTEDRGQRTEDRGQRAGGRGQKTEDRGQGTGDRRQMPENEENARRAGKKSVSRLLFFLTG
jgi:hypothetical protein